jgi:hypothetical protein
MSAINFFSDSVPRDRFRLRGAVSLLAASLLMFPLVLVAPSAVFVNLVRMAESEIPHDANRHQNQDVESFHPRRLRHSHSRRWRSVRSATPVRSDSTEAACSWYTPSVAGHFYSNGHCAPLLR